MTGVPSELAKELNEDADFLDAPGDKTPGLIYRIKLMRQAAELLAAWQTRAEVTEDMIESAVDAYDDVYEAEITIGNSMYTDNNRVAMRAALTAALAQVRP